MRSDWQAGNFVSYLPTVSVIVVNLNGRALLGKCLDSLAAQTYPREKIQAILVDNASTDDSLPFVHSNYPWVCTVQADRNLGFAAACNLGAVTATGDFLALLNNDAQADPEWLYAMIGTADANPEAACIASKILDQDGKAIDFVGTAMNLYGRAFQIDEGMPVSPDLYDEPRELLAPCGAAMLIRRDLFRQLGGFDEDFFAYYEDVDLGWRLWLIGHKVLFSPEAVVYHNAHQTGSSFPVEQRYTLSEANALRMLIKNLDDQNLARVLPFSLFLAVKRCIEQAGLDRSSYRFGSPAPGNAQAGSLESERRMTRIAASFLVAIDQIGEELPHLLEKREQIQSARMRTDAEIFTRFPMQTGNPIFPWRRYHVVQDQLVRSLGVSEVLQPKHGSRLLIITHETIGAQMAGPGIRAWELACALSRRFEVMLAAPGEPCRHHDRVRLLGYEADDPSYCQLRSYIVNADVVLVMGSLLTRIPPLQDLGKPTIVDLYDPFELEKLAQSTCLDEQYHPALDRESDASLSLEAGIGDFYICASERQRDFWLGVLLANGRINTLTYAQDPTLRTLIDVVPFGMPQRPPRRRHRVLKGIHPGIGTDDKLLFWNGGLWQWFDPLTLLDALVLVLASRDDVKLYFAAGKHFNTDTVPEMPIYSQAVEYCRELDLLDRYVFLGEWIPYDERADYLLEADLGVSIHKSTLESRFASRSRILDCMWAGLPVISTEGDPLSDMLAQRGLGRPVPAGRPDALAEAILEMLADESLHRRIAAQTQGIRDEFAWSRSVEPIGRFLEQVAFAPDALNASRRASKAWRERFDLRKRISELEADLAELRQDQEDRTFLQQRINELEADLDEMRQGQEGRIAMQQRISELEAHLEEIRLGRVMRLLRAVDVALGRD